MVSGMRCRLMVIGVFFTTVAAALISALAAVRAAGRVFVVVAMRVSFSPGGQGR